MHFYSRYQQCLQSGQPEPALHYLMQHLAVHPRHAAGYFQAGNLLRDLDQWPQALRAFIEACRLEPGQGVFQMRLGVTYQQMQQPEAAIQAYNTAYELSGETECLFKRGLARLMAGYYPEGWQDYELRIQSSVISHSFTWHPPERLWRGQPFPGQTLVVYTEQGLGDDLQFCRYLPYVKALGGTVIFATRREVLPVIATLYGVDQVVEHSPATYASLGFHWAIPLMSLPHLCHTSLDTLPNQTPYLSVPPACINKWQTLLQPYLNRTGIKNIGFVYACNHANYGSVRTCPLSYWHSLFDLPGTQWFSLQKGDAAAAVTEYAARYDNVTDLSGHIHDFADTAALLDKLDLLVSVDTSVPHLAGALDKPAWLLLPFVVDWRWLLHRSDSPWYPSFRLFRQPLPGQWEPVIAQVAQALENWQSTKAVRLQHAI